MKQNNYGKNLNERRPLMHILAVDDSPIIRKLKPDIITMDLTMPVMDGITAAKLIKQSNPNQKIIMLSAMGDRDLLAEARMHGITDFFTKPFKPAEIITKIRQIT